MFRASACFAFIIAIFMLAATLSYLVIQAAGLTGLPGYLLGSAIFVLVLTALVMLLSLINDHINLAAGPMHDYRSRRRHTNY